MDPCSLFRLPFNRIRILRWKIFHIRILGWKMLRVRILHWKMFQIRLNDRFRNLSVKQYLINRIRILTTYLLEIVSFGPSLVLILLFICFVILFFYFKVKQEIELDLNCELFLLWIVWFAHIVYQTSYQWCGSGLIVSGSGSGSRPDPGSLNLQIFKTSFNFWK